MTAQAYGSAAKRLLELSARVGATHVFANLGSDHPAFIEAFASLQAAGAAHPRVVICPHEMTALSAAHGYAMITREPQLVLVHVDVGTANLGGAVHNAARARVPVIVVAGQSPVTDGSERTASRTEYIHYIQDASHQYAIVAPYAKWTYELRAGEMTDKILLRGRQFATSEPQGLVYISGAREIWEEAAGAKQENPEEWPQVQLKNLSASAANEIVAALEQARRPLILTSYLGRTPAAVEKLVALSERIGIGVCEIVPQYLNFPGDHPHHLGYEMNWLIDQADCILLIDIDVPWIPTQVQPRREAAILHIDCDPLKETLGYWHFPARRVWQADSACALEQMLECFQGPSSGRDERIAWIRDVRSALSQTSEGEGEGVITPQELAHAVRDLLNPQSIVLMEYPTGTRVVPRILRLSRPGSFFTSGASSLGWGINAAIGAKLAKPQSEIIAVVGDGCYQYGVPSSTYWVSSTYKTPFLTIICNNGGWQSPKYSTDLVHPEGEAKKHDLYWSTASANAKLAEIAAASGDAIAFTVKERRTLKQTLHDALKIVRSGRSAVVDVSLTRFSNQALG